MAFCPSIFFLTDAYSALNSFHAGRWLRPCLVAPAFTLSPLVPCSFCQNQIVGLSIALPLVWSSTDIVILTGLSLQSEVLPCVLFSSTQDLASIPQLRVVMERIVRTKAARSFPGLLRHVKDGQFGVGRRSTIPKIVMKMRRVCANWINIFQRGAASRPARPIPLSTL